MKHEGAELESAEQHRVVDEAGDLYVLTSRDDTVVRYR